MQRRIISAVWTAIAGLLLVSCQTVQVSPKDTPRTFERGGVFVGEKIVERFGIDFAAIRKGADRRAGMEWSAAYTLAKLDELDAKIPAGEKVPVIVYMHGCGGPIPASLRHVDKLTKLGNYIVASPNSFARPRPVVCRAPGDTDFHVMWQSRGWRRAELDYALDQLASHKWVDRRNIFLVGHSQGATAVLDYGGDVSIKGRVAMHGGCEIGQLGDFTDNTRPEEMLLGFHSGRDRWYARFDSGCPLLVARHPNGILIEERHSTSHDLINQQKYWDILADWLRKHTTR